MRTLLLASVAFLALLGCDARSTTEPVHQAHRICPEVGFFVTSEGELVKVYTKGPDAPYIGPQGILLKPGECVTVVGLQE